MTSRVGHAFQEKDTSSDGNNNKRVASAASGTLGSGGSPLLIPSGLHLRRTDENKLLFAPSNRSASSPLGLPQQGKCPPRVRHSCWQGLAAPGKLVAPAPALGARGVHTPLLGAALLCVCLGQVGVGGVQANHWPNLVQQGES